jgi:hypothetical protein
VAEGAPALVPRSTGSCLGLHQMAGRLSKEEAFSVGKRGWRKEAERTRAKGREREATDRIRSPEAGFAGYPLRKVRCGAILVLRALRGTGGFFLGGI